MAHNTRTRAGWVSGTVLLATEMADLDQKTFTALSENGGTWATVTPIVVGGAGMTAAFVGANTLTFGSLSLSSSTIDINNASTLVTHVGTQVTVGGSLTLTSTASGYSAGYFEFSTGSTTKFYGSSTWENGSIAVAQSGSAWAFASGSSLNFSAGANFSVDCPAFFGGNVHIYGNSITDGSATFNGAASFTGSFSAISTSVANITVSNTATVNGQLNIDCPGELTGAMACLGAGRVKRNAVFLPASGTTNIDAAVATNYIANGQTGDLILNIVDSYDGDILFVKSFHPTYTTSIYNPSAGLLFYLKSASGFATSAWFQRVLGNWYLIDSNVVP